MLETSLVTHNSIAQFAARFEMQADGSVLYYHPDRKTGGLPCTLAECEQMIQEFAQSRTRTMHRMMIWAIFSGIVIGLLDASETLLIAKWQQYSLILAPFPFMLLAWQRAGLKPLRVLKDRTPCTPPRSRASAFWQRVAALPASLFFYMLLPSAGLAYYAFQKGWENMDISSLIIIGSNLLMTGIWLYARRR